MFVIHNGTTSEAYDYVDGPCFSPDSAHIAYRTKQSSKWSIVLDGTPQQSYDLVGSPYFSPDSRSLAYQAVKENKALMVLNGKEEAYVVDSPLEPYSPKVTRPCFSPDSQHVAYLVKPKALTCVLVIDGNAIESFNLVLSQELDPPIIIDASSNARLLVAYLKGERFNYCWFDITLK
jgi:Tol biopolymer transport system component